MGEARTDLHGGVIPYSRDSQECLIRIWNLIGEDIICQSPEAKIPIERIRLRLKVVHLELFEDSEREGRLRLRRASGEEFAV